MLVDTLVSPTRNHGPWAVRLVGVASSRPGPEWSRPIDLTFSKASRVGIIGSNGSGKSTLLKLVAGSIAPASGSVLIAPTTSIGYLAQEVDLPAEATVREAIEAGVSSTRSLLARQQEVSALLGHRPSADLLRELGELLERIEAVHGWDLDAQVTQALAALGCPPEDAVVGHLSAGERRRVALCRLLLSRPDLLLLDEPTNDLDLEATAWLERFLQDYAGTVLFATHDRQLLNRTVQWIVELDRRGAHRYAGGYTDYLEARIKDFVVSGGKDADQLQQLQWELDWARSGRTARQEVRTARLQQHQRTPGPARRSPGQIPVPPAPRLGRDVLTTTHLSVRIGGRVLIDDLSFSVPPGAVVGVVGPNGVGKSTLLRIIARQLAPSSGSLRFGASVAIAYSDPQATHQVGPSTTAHELLSEGSSLLRFGGSEMSSRGYLAAFGFKGSDQDKPVRLFSGGERARLNLALTFKQQGNLILLDEPSNELDLPTRSALELALLEFDGCAMIASHDRWFLDRLATHLLVWAGAASPGRWIWYDGHLSDHEATSALVKGEGAERSMQRRFPDRQFRE